MWGRRSSVGRQYTSSYTDLIYSSSIDMLGTYSALVSAGYILKNTERIFTTLTATMHFVTDMSTLDFGLKSWRCYRMCRKEQFGGLLHVSRIEIRVAIVWWQRFIEAVNHDDKEWLQSFYNETGCCSDGMSSRHWDRDRPTDRPCSFEYHCVCRVCHVNKLVCR